MPASKSADFIAWIAEKISGEPTPVEAKIDARGEILTVSVPGEKMGRMIGRNGKTITALRGMLRILRDKSGATGATAIRLAEA